MQLVNGQKKCVTHFFNFNMFEGLNFDITIR